MYFTYLLYVFLLFLYAFLIIPRLLGVYFEDIYENVCDDKANFPLQL